MMLEFLSELHLFFRALFSVWFVVFRNERIKAKFVVTDGGVTRVYPARYYYILDL